MLTEYIYLGGIGWAIWKIKFKNSIQQKLFENLSHLFFCCRTLLCRFKIEYDFIHMAAVTGLTVTHSIRPTFGQFFDWCHITYPGLQIPNCLWFISITLFFNGISQKIAQWSQIAIDITIVANYSAIKILMQ